MAFIYEGWKRRKGRSRQEGRTLAEEKVKSRRIQGRKKIEAPEDFSNDVRRGWSWGNP